MSATPSGPRYRHAARWRGTRKRANPTTMKTGTPAFVKRRRLVDGKRVTVRVPAYALTRQGRRREARDAKKEAA